MKSDQQPGLRLSIEWSYEWNQYKLSRYDINGRLIAGPHGFNAGGKNLHKFIASYMAEELLEDLENLNKQRGTRSYCKYCGIRIKKGWRGRCTFCGNDTETGNAIRK